MTSRERVYRATTFQGPDRVPIVHSTLPGAFLKYGPALQELYRRYPADVRPVGYYDPNEYGPAAQVGSRDDWGAVWKRLGNDHKGQVVEHPLADWRALRTYRAPPPITEEERVRLRQQIRADRGEHYLQADLGTLWQRMFYLRGFEAVLLDLATDRAEAYQLRDLILKHILARIEALQAFAIDGFLLRDDWGAQDRLLIRPARWREFFQPAYQQIAAAVRAAGKHLEFHSDGQTREILPDLAEIGCQVLNPQMAVVGIDWLSRTLGGRVCLHTDLDRQHLLPRGTPQQVEEHVHQALEAFGRFHGGCWGGGEIAPDVPLENAEAMLRAIWEHRF